MHSAGCGAKLEPLYPLVSLRQVMEFYKGIEYIAINLVKISMW